MKLVSEWKLILKKAWSIRLMLVAGVLSGLEVVLPFLSPGVPDGLMAVLSGCVVCAAFVARLLAQKEIES